jgi:putative transposase
MVERMNPALPISQHCRLLARPRSSVYRKPAAISAEDLAIMALIDRQYLARPDYGSRRMAAWLATQGHHVNRKRVQRLMRRLGLTAICQRPNTSTPAAAHKIYPYLLRERAIDRVNQVWCSDITDIPMTKGFLYLVVIMDRVSRAVLAWRVSHTLGGDFCVDALEEALSRYGRSEIFNTDQGSRFTSDDFTGTLKRHGVTISMDGKSLPSRKRGAGASTTSSSSGCGAASKTRRSTSMPMRQWPKPRPASAPGWTFTTPSASTRAWVTARRGKFTKKACGYGDDRRCRPAALPPLPEPARKAGKCSPSPTSPQPPPPTSDWILMTSQ